MVKKYEIKNIEWRGTMFNNIIKNTVTTCYREIEKKVYSQQKYNEFLNWFKLVYELDKTSIEKSQLEHFEQSFSEIRNMINNLCEENKEINVYLKINKIDRKNRETFNVFLEDIKEEYRFLSETNEKEITYRQMNRIVSWYSLTDEYIKAAINNLSKNELNLEKLEIKQLNLENESNITEIEMEHKII